MSRIAGRARAALVTGFAVALAAGCAEPPTREAVGGIAGGIAGAAAVGALASPPGAAAALAVTAAGGFAGSHLGGRAGRRLDERRAAEAEIEAARPGGATR